MVIDSHMHVNSQVLENKDRFIQAINNNPLIDKVINVGLDLTSSKETVDIAQVNPKFYSAVGIHPLYTKSDNLNSLYDLASNEKVVAIGEIGLDNTKDNLEEQIKYLVEQILIANQLHLPVIIHSNNYNKLIISIFENYVKPQYGCVFHCFQPNLEDLAYLVNNGFYISFAGKITYKTAKKSLVVAREVPNNLFLVETDSPYISPEPVINEINETANIKYIISKLAEIKQTSFNDIAKITNENTRRLFRKIKL